MPAIQPPASALDRESIALLRAANLQPFSQSDAPAAAGHAALPVDTISLSIAKAGLTPEMLDALLEVLNNVFHPQMATPLSAQAESSYQSARSAARQQDIEQILVQLERALLADPRYISRSNTDPVFQHYRALILTIVQRLAARTRILAEDRILKASAAIEKGKPLLLEEAVPEAVLLLSLARSAAAKSNYPDLFVAFRAAQLSHEAANSYIVQTASGTNICENTVPPFAPASIGALARKSIKARRYYRAGFPALQRIWSRLRRPAINRLRSLWRRYPLLALFMAWLALGLLAGVLSVALRKLDPAIQQWRFLHTAFPVWGMGFLVLAGLGFILSIWRSAR